MPVPKVIDGALARRRAAALRPPSARKFMAARPDRLAGGFSSLGYLHSPRAEVREDLRGLVAHARHGARNVDYLRGFEMMTRRNVVGHRGIQLQMRPRDSMGDLDPTMARAIAAEWAAWGRRGHPTACGRLAWWNVERIAATMVKREGNFLARHRTGPSYGRWGYQLEILPLDVLDIDLVQTLGGGRYIDGGVEFDSRGRVAAFHIWSESPSEHRSGRRMRRLRVPASEIVHVYDPTESLQALGVPASHTALRRLNMTGKYEESALAAADFGASAMAFIKRDTEDGMPAASEDAPLLPEEIEGGMIAELPPGADLSSWTPNYPDGEMPEFVGHMLRGAASGLGVAYSSLASDLRQANFSSLRAGLGEERDQWRDDQRVLFEGLHDPVFRRWLAAAVLSGQVPMRPADLPRYLDAATWRPRGWASVNPKDDATANEADLRNRLRPPSAIVADRGEDWGETVERFAADIAVLEAAGIAPPAAMTGTATTTPEPPPAAVEGDPPDTSGDPPDAQ